MLYVFYVGSVVAVSVGRALKEKRFDVKNIFTKILLNDLNSKRLYKNLLLNRII